MSLLRPSRWSLDLDHHRNPAGTRADIVLMSGGSLVMIDPSSSSQSLYFGRAAPRKAFSVGVPRIKLPRMKLPELNVRETESDDEDDLSDEEMKRAKSDVSKPETDNEEDQHDEAEADEAEEDEAEADADNRQREQERANSSDDALNQKRQDSEEDSRPASTPKTGNGTVFMTHAFYGAELSRSDLRGAAVYIPARPGSEFFIGPARPAMLLGINAAELMMGLASPTTLHIAERAIARARALLLLDGVHVVPRDGLEFLVGHLN